MTPYYVDESVTLYHGDALDVLRDLADASVDAVVTDPPYDLTGVSRNGSARVAGTGPFGRHLLDTKRGGFMGKEWDGTGIAFRIETWADCLRVLKPGGHLLAFGGTRTYHRLTCAIEDAGFEIRDSITWIYGSGFPKSLDVSKAIDKAAGAEREIIGPRRWHGKDPNGTLLGIINDDGWVAKPDTDPSVQLTAPATEDGKRWAGWGTALKPAHEPIVVARKPLAGNVAANVLAYGTGALNVDGCRIGTAEEKRWPADTRKRRRYDPGSPSKEVMWTPHDGLGRWPSNVVLDDAAAALLDQESGDVKAGGYKDNRGRPHWNRESERDDVFTSYGDSGGASRFFPVFRYEAKADSTERPRANGTAHPTVKPLGLMRWLVRLVTPPGGIVLDPFAGSGTTAEACVIEGFRCVAVEKEPAYLPLIVARLSKPIQPVLEVSA